MVENPEEMGEQNVEKSENELDSREGFASTEREETLGLLGEEGEVGGSPNAIQKRIRAFLVMLFSEMGSELPEGWPDVSASEYARCYRWLRERTSRLYDFLHHDPSQDLVQHLFARFYGESTLHLLELDYKGTKGHGKVLPAVEACLEHRPALEVGLDQLYCTPGSTQRRAEKVLEVTEGEPKRVLFVGDDDLGSLALAQDVLGFVGEIHVIDLDERLLSMLGEQAPRIVTHKIDLILGGLPSWMYGYFDTVVLDPPWDLEGAWSFLSCALYALKKQPEARILLASCPIQMELVGTQMQRFWKRLARHGLVCESIEPNFHLYDVSVMATPEYQKAFGLYIPTVQSPFLEVLLQVPYTFSHMYVLRRLQHWKWGRLREFYFRWRQTDGNATSLPPGEALDAVEL